MAWPNRRVLGCSGMAKSPGETGARPASRVRAILRSSCSRALGTNTPGPARYTLRLTLPPPRTSGGPTQTSAILARDARAEDRNRLRIGLAEKTDAARRLNGIEPITGREYPSGRSSAGRRWPSRDGMRSHASHCRAGHAASGLRLAGVDACLENPPRIWLQWSSPSEPRP